MKRALTILLALFVMLAVSAGSAAGLGKCSETEMNGDDRTVEVGRLDVKVFGPIQKLDYIARYGKGDLVVLGVDGGWNPERSIAYQEQLAEFNILYVRPAASNDAYEPRKINAVNEVYKENQERFARYIVPLLNEKFPTQRVALFGYSRGGWYLEELYKELKASGRTVVFAWCNDGCPGDKRNIYGFPELEKDGIPIYVAMSSVGGGNIVNRTYAYAESGNPNIVFSKKYDSYHNTLSIAIADDFRDTLLQYID